MKRLSILLLTMVALPAYSQSMLGTLNSYQDSLQESEANSSSGSGSSSSSNSSSNPEVKPSSETINSSSVKCEENDQTSLPLAYVTSLIQKKNASLDILHDPRMGSLKISSADMIGNCSSMLEWKLKQPEIQGSKAYALEVHLKKGDDCTDEGCSYKVAKVEKGEFQKYEPMVFKPTLKGFESCLQQSGVVVEGKVVPGAIYNQPVNEKFSGLDHSGQLLFLSHGPASTLVKPKYGQFEQILGCDHYEAAHPQVKGLLTLADSEKQRLDAEAENLRGCKVDEYGKLAEFIEKYESYSAELGDVRDRLILEAAKKSAAAIAAGKYTEEDLKLLADFERYVVNPKVEKAVALYNEMIDLEGDAKKEKQEELKLVLAEISALNQKPYFLSSHTQKLLTDGRFEEAEKINSFKLVLENHQRLGAKQDNVVITPQIAMQRVAASRANFTQTVVKEKERYEIRTGQVTGNAQNYANLAQRMRNNIQVRNQNFAAEIQTEYARVQQPNGYCYKYWRNTQKCIQDTVERIQELQALLTHYNKVDTERATEYDAQAKEYSDLEAQGRRYIAAQNGEPIPEETATVPTATIDTTVPTARPQESPGVYSFNFQGGNQQGQAAQQQAQMTPQQYQYPMNPYANQNMFQTQQNPYAPYMAGQQGAYMGQQSYGQYGMQQQNMYGMQGQAGYSFNIGGGNQYGYQQQNPYMYQGQQGYWQQPYQSNNMYSMYGRTW